MGFRLAEMFVELGVKSHLGAGFAQAKRETIAAANGLNAAVSTVGRSFAMLATGATIGGLAAIGAGLYKGVQGASDLGESLSKVSAVFGPDAKAITDFADEMAKAFGSSRREMIDSATEAGILAQGLGGLANGPAARVGVEITRLADDLVSFANVAGGVPAALLAINSGLRGESEPMSRYGVMLQEEQVKNEAFRLGLVKTRKELDNLTQAQKFAARLSLIKTGLAKQSGDHERTKGSSKNREREIGGRIENALTSVGQSLMPIWSELVNGV